MKNYIKYWLPELINIIAVVTYLVLLMFFNNEIKSEITSDNWITRSFEILQYDQGKAFNYLLLAFGLSLLEIVLSFVFILMYKRGINSSPVELVIVTVIVFINIILLIGIIVEIANPILVAFVIVMLIGGGVGVSMS